MKDMAIIDQDDVLAYRVEGEGIVCADCINDAEFHAVRQDDVIEQNDSRDDEMIFCDRCKERLN